MPRLRKLRRKQKFQYNVNRRKLNQKRQKLPRIDCDAVREAWDTKKSLTDNLTSMGLMADPNKSVGKRETHIENENVPQASASTSNNTDNSVANTLELEAKDAFVKKKAVAHPLPPEMVKKLCAFLDKHGEDFEAMAMDPTNFYQETAAQLRTQVNRLKKVPQQWIPYLKGRNLLPADNESGDGE